MWHSWTKGAAVALCLASPACLPGAAAASGSLATLHQQSSQIYWGQTGAHAVLLLYYGLFATGTLTIKVISTSDLSGATLPEQIPNCGTPVVQGGVTVAYTLTPGQHCFVLVPRPSGGVGLSAELLTTDGTIAVGGTQSSANMDGSVRASLEIRAANDLVLSHVELQ